MENHPYQEPEYRPADAGRQQKPFQFPLWAIIVAFVIWWPMGIVFLVLNELIKEGKLDLSAAARTRAPRPTPKNTPIYAQPEPEETKKTSKDKSEATGEVGLFIAGLCLLFTGMVALPEGFYWLADALQSGGTYWLWLLEELIPAMGMLAGGVGCLFGAGKMKASRRMRKKLKNIVGTADYRHIEDIAAAIPCDYAKCCRLLEDAIDKGTFGPGAYLDMSTRCLVVKGQPPAPEPDPAPAPAAAPADPYQAELDELRRINEDIDDVVMSEKISRLERVSDRIFDQARDNPDKLPQMRKFMDYYLPTAKKLLKTYAELEEQGIEGDNITESKTRIANAMDTLVTAFENQLDRLFQSDALDVSTDIDVMENMLRADGLAEDPFSLKN